MKDTKRKIIIILSIILVLCIALLSGGIYLYNEILPMAKPIQTPEIHSVQSVFLSRSKTSMSISMDANGWESLFSQISEVKPTRIQAWNDYPTAQPYYCIEIQTADRAYLYFVYKDGNRIYVEVPYEGIYETNANVLHTVQAHFQEG